MSIATETPARPVIYVDADACPVKDEIAKVAARLRVRAVFVSNAFMRLPDGPGIERVVVEAGPDAADDWIAERFGPRDVVVTQDIPLADRALKAGAQALHPTGRAFTPESIGSALAGREIGEHLRSMGVATAGPKPFAKLDRSKFLQALDLAMQRAVRR